MSYVPLNAENCMQNDKKKIKVIFWQFSLLSGKNCLHKFNSSVLYYIRFILFKRDRVCIVYDQKWS